MLPVAPGMFTPPLRHWYVRPVPVAVTAKLTGLPVHTDALEGLAVTDGGAFTVRLAADEVAGGLHVPLTTTSYEPASPAVTDGML